MGLCLRLRGQQACEHPSPPRTTPRRGALTPRAGRTQGSAMPLEEALPGVGGANAAGSLPAVECQHRRSRAPRTRKPPSNRDRNASACRNSSAARPTCPSNSASAAPAHQGGIDVALHLAKCDRSHDRRAVRMEDGVVRVFPALVKEAVGGSALDTPRSRRRRGRRSDRSTRARPRHAAGSIRRTPGRRSVRSMRPRAGRIEAWHPRCHSSGRMGSPSARPSHRGTVSCWILPGSASSSGMTSVAWVAAR